MSKNDLNLAFPVILDQPGVVLSEFLRLLLDLQDHLLLRFGYRNKLPRCLPRDREGGVGYEVIKARVLGSPLLRGVGNRRLECFSECLWSLWNALLERELKRILRTTRNRRETRILEALPGISIYLIILVFW